MGFRQQSLTSDFVEESVLGNELLRPVGGTFAFEAFEVDLLEGFFNGIAEGTVEILKTSVRGAVFEGDVPAGGLDFILEVIPKRG